LRQITGTIIRALESIIDEMLAEADNLAARTPVIGSLRFGKVLIKRLAFKKFAAKLHH